MAYSTTVFLWTLNFPTRRDAHLITRLEGCQAQKESKAIKSKSWSRFYLAVRLTMIYSYLLYKNILYLTGPPAAGPWSFYI